MGNKARWVMFHLLSSISRFELWSYPSLTLIFWLPVHQRRAASSRPTVAEQLGRPKGSPSTKCPTYYPSHFALMNNNVPYAQPSRTSSYFHQFYYALLGLALWMDKGKTKEDDRPDPTFRLPHSGRSQSYDVNPCSLLWAQVPFRSECHAPLAYKVWLRGMSYMS